MVEARINDIPVVQGQAGETKSSNIPIREYIVPGKNTLSLEIRGEREEVKLANDNMNALARVADFGEGDWLELDEGRELALLNPNLGPETKIPFRGEVGFEVASGPSWKWSKAPLLNLDSVRREADRLLQDMAKEFARKDAVALLKRVEQRMTEDLNAYPAIPLEGRKADFERMITRERPKWKPVEFDPENTDYRLVAGGRLLEARDKNGLPVLRTETLDPSDPLKDPNYVGLKVLLGKLGGELVVLR